MSVFSDSLRQRSLTRLLLVCAMVFTVRSVSADGQSAKQADGFQNFAARVQQYEKLRKMAEKDIPPAKKKDKPDGIAARRQALVAKIRELRSDAKQGDVFAPDATAAITQAIQQVFAGPDAQRVQGTIQAGDPLQGFQVQVNQTYPDGLPFTTVPPSLLLKLPTIPDLMSYRILGSTLLLVDRDASLIIDFMPNVIP